MINISLFEAARAMNGTLYGEAEKNIEYVFIDSRDGENKNGLFFALKGDRIDGHIFVAEILSKGHFAVVSDKEYFKENTILVENTKRALGLLAAYYRKKIIPNVKIIAVTGSVGKTTTKDMIYSVLSSEYKTYGTKGNRNSLTGVPLSIMDIDNSYSFAVLEAGMSESGEIAILSEMIKPDIAVITTIGTSHIEAFGSIESIAKEKFSIVKGLKQNGNLIISKDNKYIQNTAITFQKIYCGFTDEADCSASKITEDQYGSSFKLTYNQKQSDIKLQLLGKHNIQNAMYAYVAGNICGVSEENIIKSLYNFIPSGNRQKIYIEKDIRIIADCYNASPESMEAALNVLSSFQGKKIAVLGDMLELGDQAEELHKNVARKAAAAADELIFIGDNAELYKNTANKGYTFKTEDKLKSIPLIKQISEKGSTILFKASNRLHFEDIIKELDL
ncbi:UDP-N-acetylmuramoyl-tripeptide--D-alanyl-D-alanine ligase [Eubacteriales bacterium OttesenSCG-928-G02]|nr:UDP-N-acetylmuramoyl-tripeptide--D-alanyl-D-alanine ligase [Eubacteriales bacterium OttesenSCG-928-G02]